MGVPRVPGCPTLFLGFHRCPTVFLVVSSFSYVAPTVFHGVSRCPTGFLGLIGVPLCSSVFLCVTRFPTLFFYSVLFCYTVFLWFSRFLQCSSGFFFCPTVFFVILRCSLGFFCVRVSSGFGAPHGSSAFLLIIRCSSGFLVVLGFLRVAKLFCGVTRRSGFLPRQLLLEYWRTRRKWVKPRINFILRGWQMGFEQRCR